MQKKKYQKEKIKTAFSPLLHSAIFGDKKNSLRSNSFLSLSENRCVPLYATKMRSVCHADGHWALLLLPAVLAFFLPFSGRYGLIAGGSAEYGGKEVEGGRHVLGGAVLVVGTVAGILSVPPGCTRMLLLPGGMFHFGGWLRQVNAFLPGEKVVEHACGELLAQTGAVEDGFGGMVDEGRPIDAPGFILTEYHADALPHEFPLELRPVMPCGLHLSLIDI